MELGLTTTLHTSARTSGSRISQQQDRKTLSWNVAQSLLYSQNTESIAFKYSLSYLLTELVRDRLMFARVIRCTQCLVQAFSRENEMVEPFSRDNWSSAIRALAHSSS
jgi:hypothetical protein